MVGHNQFKNYQGILQEELNKSRIISKTFSGIQLEDLKDGQNSLKEYNGILKDDFSFGINNLKSIDGYALDEQLNSTIQRLNRDGITLHELITCINQFKLNSGYDLEIPIIGNRKRRKRGVLLNDSVTPEHILVRHGYVFII